MMIRAIYAVSVAAAACFALLVAYQLGEVSMRQSVFVERFDMSAPSGYQFYGSCETAGAYAYCPEFDHESHTGFRR
jgi:hypothetical protein